jgi:hypothetical protein
MQQPSQERVVIIVVIRHRDSTEADVDTMQQLSTKVVPFVYHLRPRADVYAIRSTLQSVFSGQEMEEFMRLSPKARVARECCHVPAEKGT